LAVGWPRDRRDDAAAISVPGAGTNGLPVALPLTPGLAVMTTSVAVALPLPVIGAFLLDSPNPPLDAAQPDIIRSRLGSAAKERARRCDPAGRRLPCFPADSVFLSYHDIDERAGVGLT
jgi:hypothetical protein